MRAREQKLLLVVFIVLLLFALPTWPYSADWGYFPSGGLAVFLLILLLVIFVETRRPLAR